MRIEQKDPAYFEDLLKKARLADQVAFETLYIELYKPIYQFIYYRVGQFNSRTQLAEDLSQDVFLKIFTHIQSGGMDNFSGNFVGYAFAIARNLIIDYARKRKESLLVSEDESFDDYESQDMSQEELAHIRQVGAQIFKYIEQLPESMQEVLIMSFVHEYTTEEIGALLEKTEEAVRQLKSRGLRRLRYIMQGHKDII